MTKAKAIELTNRLENRPLAPDAKQMRKDLLAFLVAVPDITVVIVGGMLGDLDAFGENNASLLLSQYAFSLMCYVIENPRAPGNDEVAQQAAVEGALRTYVNMKAQRPKLSIQPMENLLRLKADGKLTEHVRQILRSYKPERTAPPSRQ